MKFGNFMDSEKLSEWELYYLDYAVLKKWLKVKSTAVKNGTQEVGVCEAQFQQLIGSELKKVNDFFLRTSEHVLSKIDGFRKVLSADTIEYQKSKQARHGLQRHLQYLERLITNLHYFSWLNEVGFKKILKKHDKVMGVLVSPWAIVRVEEQSFVNSGRHFSRLLIKFSECCAKVRVIQTGRDERGHAVGGAAAQSFQRETVKYWVESRDVMRVKTHIARHLPLYIFDSKQEQEAAQITSCYYDNPETMELYEGRLRKTEGAIAVRFRRYENATEVFAERKTHHESWVTGKVSIKERFTLEPSDVFEFITGKYTEEDFEKHMDAQNFPPKARTDALKLFREMQFQIRSRRLCPTMTTAYKRTAFQIPGDARVRISLDTDLKMIRESLQLVDNQWHLPDYETKPQDIHHFPYAVLEVKLQTQEGVAPPAWVKELTEGPMCRIVHKFSKFVHGCAVHLPSRCPCFPPWIQWPEFEAYLKDPSRLPALPNQFSSGIDPAGGGRPAPPSDDEDEVEMDEVLVDFTNPPRGEEEGGGGLREDSDPPTSTCYTLLSLVNLEHLQGRQFRGQPIIERVKIEPKTYFALERTYLRWISVSIMLESIGIALISFSGGQSQNSFAFTTGMAYTLIATVFMGYALWMYRWRAYQIRTQCDTNFDAVWGPVFLFIAIVTATILNLAIHFANPSQADTVDKL